MGRITATALVGAFMMLADVSGPLAGQAPPLWGDLEPGAYGVGLRVAFSADSARAFGGRPWRPIRIMVWYPAAGTGGTRLRLGDLLALRSADTAFADYAHAMRERDSSTAARQFAAPADSLTDWITGVALAARRDAPPAAGRFPLVLYSLGGNDYQLEGTVLWEYLASRGFVVVVVPQLGPEPGRPGLDFTIADLEIQRDDLRHAWRVAARLPFVDGARAVVIGHSAGALAGLLLADASEAVVGLASLDGSIASPDGVRALLDAGLDLARARPPLLALFAMRADRPDLTVLDRLTNTQFRVGFGTGRPPALATHFDFQNWPLFGELRGIADPRGASARPAALGAAYYRTAVRLTAAFAAHVLTGAPADLISGGATVPGIDNALLRFDARGH